MPKLLHAGGTIPRLRPLMGQAAEPRNRQSLLEPCGVMPARLFTVRRSGIVGSPGGDDDEHWPFPHRIDRASQYLEWARKHRG
jgi:hypothetical protein